MKTYPNQYAIKIEKRVLRPGEFTSIDSNALFFAIRELSPSGLKLFLYLSNIPTGGVWHLSMAIVTAALNISTSSFHRAKKELLEVGLLEKTENGSFIFRQNIAENVKNE